MALFISENDVSELLTMDEAVGAIEDVFKQWANGKATLVPRFSVDPPNEPGNVYPRWFMPAMLYGSGVVGVKILLFSVPGSSGPTKEEYLILIFDAVDGSVLAHVEGKELTKIRTGAVTAVATKYLAQKKSRSLGILGSSKYAEMQAIGVCSVRDIDMIRVFSPNYANCSDFANRLRGSLDVEINACRSSEAVVKQSDIIVTVTNSKEPVFSGDWISKGTHINAVGSSFPDSREVDDVTVSKSKVVVEYMNQALLEAGDIVIPISNGTITKDDIYGEISSVVSGKMPGRASEDEITLFKSNGVALEDVACALKVFQKAKILGGGKEFGLT